MGPHPTPCTWAKVWIISMKEGFTSLHVNQLLDHMMITPKSMHANEWGNSKLLEVYVRCNLMIDIARKDQPFFHIKNTTHILCTYRLANMIFSFMTKKSYLLCTYQTLFIQNMDKSCIYNVSQTYFF